MRALQVFSLLWSENLWLLTERKQNRWPPGAKTTSKAIHGPMLQAEFSANAEKVARARTKNPCDSREFQVALSVQPFKRGT
jgi:hypothetical protein